MPVQTSYTVQTNGAYAGTQASLDPMHCVTAENIEASDALAFGNAVAMSGSGIGVVRPDSGEILGLVVRTNEYDAELDLADSGESVKAGKMVVVATRGTMWVKVAAAVTRGSRLHIVKATGACRATADSTNTWDAEQCGRFLTAASADGYAQLQFDFLNGAVVSDS